AIGNQLRRAKQELRAPRRRHKPPALVGEARRVDRVRDVGRGRLLEHAHDVVRIRGISVLEHFARNRGYPDAVNKVVMRGRGGPGAGDEVESAVQWTHTATTCRNDYPTIVYGHKPVATFWSQLETDLQLCAEILAVSSQLQGLFVARILNSQVG